MSDFSDTNVLRKILNAIPGIQKPVKIQTIDKWRDDFSGTSLSSDWETPIIGSGQSIQVSNSELRISSGTIAGAQTTIRSKVKFNLPCRIGFIYYMSQRLLNNWFHLEVVDSTGQNYARFVLNTSGTTSCNFDLANNGFAGNSGSLSTLNSNSYALLELDIEIDELKFVSRQVDTLSGRNATLIRQRKLPNPALDYYIQIRCFNSNTAPTSNTNLFLDSITYQAYEQVNADISASRGANTVSDSIPVTVLSQPSISGSVTINDGGSVNTLTDINLAANGTYTSSAFNASSRNNLTVTVITNQPGQLYVDQGVSSGSWIDYGARNCVSGINIFNISLDINWFRIRYVNGATTTTGTFAIYTKTRI